MVFKGVAVSVGVQEIWRLKVCGSVHSVLTVRLVREELGFGGFGLNA